MIVLLYFSLVWTVVSRSALLQAPSGQAEACTTPVSDVPCDTSCIPTTVDVVRRGGGITHTPSAPVASPSPPPSPSFFLFAHNDPRRVYFQIRPGSSAPRRQFYVVADPGLWSRCLGSDNIMTESAGVTRRHGRTNRHMQRHILYVAAAGWPWLFVRRRTMTSHNKGLVFCAYSCR